MNDDVYVFVGPTLAVSQAQEELDAVYLPPASEGDVYRVARRHPRALAIVDGYFEFVPAVWHKEIMWAMAQGIHVFGSASMGALRAAELELFDMRGVGWVYEAFHGGRLERDDEVAIAHLGAEEGYRPVSEALVNVRRTVEVAEHAQVISPDAGRAIIDAAAALFYRDRIWPEILAVAGGTDRAEIDRFEAWLPSGRVDQKMLDARAMLGEMRTFLSADPPPLRVKWQLADTVVWNAARRRGRASPPTLQPRTVGSVDPVLDEIRLLGPEHFERARRQALLRLLATEAAERDGTTVDGEVLDQAVEQFRLRHGLDRGEDLASYLETNEIGPLELAHLVRSDEHVRRTTESAQNEALADILVDLRLAGDYARIVPRARDKEQDLESRGLLAASPIEMGSSEDEVMRWYFEDHLGQGFVPDISEHAHACGFPDELSFRRAGVARVRLRRRAADRPRVPSPTRPRRHHHGPATSVHRGSPTGRPGVGRSARRVGRPGHPSSQRLASHFGPGLR